MKTSRSFLGLLTILLTVVLPAPISFAWAEGARIPYIMTRRRSKQAPLLSTFVGIIEPYERNSNIKGIRRLPLEADEGASYPDSNAAVEIQLADGRRDLFVAADVENPLGQKPARAENEVLVQREWGLRLDGELCLARRNADGRVERLALCRAKSVSIGELTVTLKKRTDLVEIVFNKEEPFFAAGDIAVIREIRSKGRVVFPR